MKLLCLHGYGTNGEVLRAQMQPILLALGGQQELVMLEGDIKVYASDITGNFEPPHLAYYHFPDPESVKRGHELIDDAIETDGPFDGIVGFSQGAALAMSYLLHHRIESPQAPSVFEFGVFFSCATIQSPEADYKRSEFMYILEALDAEQISSFHKFIRSPTGTQQDFAQAKFTKGLDSAQCKLILELGWMGNRLWQARDGLHITDKVAVRDQLEEDTVARDMFPRFYHPVYTAERLSIPTVHSGGRNDSDPLKYAAAMCLELCSGGHAISIPHAGRHELPVKREEAEAIAKAIEKVAFLGQQQHIASM